MTDGTVIVVIYSALTGLTFAVVFAIWYISRQAKKLRRQAQAIKSLQNSQQERLASLERDVLISVPWVTGNSTRNPK